MHKCVRCGATYQDNDETILRGCSKCGSIFFLYLKGAEDEVKAKEIQDELKAKDTTLEKEVEKKIREKKAERISTKKVGEGKTRRIEFGIETVKIPKEGVYEINLDALMKKRPLIILEKGSIYLIHLPSIFEEDEET